MSLFSSYFSHPSKSRNAWIFLFSLYAFTWAIANDIQSFDISEKQYQQINLFYGKEASSRVKDWLALLKSSTELPESEKLVKVNLFFNRLEFVSDQEHWGKQDYWATPLEMLVTNGGDCEDFSIAKYFTLRQLKVDMKKLRLTYVKAIELNQAHMVLSYFSEGEDEPLVLDNLIDEIKPASMRTDLQPIYSFNGEDLWLSKQRARGKWVGKSSQISLWTDLVKRFTQTIDAQIAPKGNKNKGVDLPPNENKQSVPRRSKL